MNIAKFILHYNTPVETANLCRVLPEAIVVNNGSKDQFQDITEIYLSDNLGFVRNWNRVIRYMLDRAPNCDAYWLMNSDIEITRECVDRVQSSMDTGLYPMLTPSFNCWMRECRNQGTGLIRSIRFMEFTAPVIRRDVFHEIGLFDERFSLGYGVDLDFCLRAQKYGIKMYCDDTVSFYHLGQRSIKNIEQYKQKANDEMLMGMKFKWGSDWRSLVGKLS